MQSGNVSERVLQPSGLRGVFSSRVNHQTGHAGTALKANQRESKLDLGGMLRGLVNSRSPVRSQEEHNDAVMMIGNGDNRQVTLRLRPTIQQMRLG